MSQGNSALARQEAKIHFIWKIAFYISLCCVAAGFYIATEKADYIWRWNRIPQYFVYNDDVQIKAEIDGEVSSFVEQGESSVVTLEGDGESEQYTVPTGKVDVSEGDFVYMGDPVGSYHEWRQGILVEGLITTLGVSAVGIFFGIILGLLTGLARIAKNPFFRYWAVTYIEIIRGSPLLVQIMIWYFVVGTLINKLLASTGIPEIPSVWFGIASLAIFAGAYVAEIVRAGIQGVNKGQMEAARSLGMSPSIAMRKIILPQAFRRILPPLAGQFISLIKDSSLLGIIAIRELTKATREASSSSLMAYEMWITCGLLYLLITFGLSMFVRHLEKKAGN